jgi:hypothetical protein
MACDSEVIPLAWFSGVSTSPVCDVYRDLRRQLSALTGSPPILGGLTLSGTKTERTKTYLLRKMAFIPICF